GAASVVADRLGDFLHDVVRHPVADRVGHLLDDRFLDPLRAGDLLAGGVVLPDLLALDLGLAAIGAPALALVPLAALGRAGAGVVANLTALLDAARLLRHAHFFVDPLAALVADGLVVAVLLPDLLLAVAVVRLDP